ncbi:MAG: hypothetical protein AAF532_02890 [Planctomycetota bacterium]
MLLKSVATFVYPADKVDLSDTLTFIELPAFERAWNRLGMTDDDLFALQVAIMSSPEGGKVIRGTGGLRKVRFRSEASDAGKSGGVRACYVYYSKWGAVLLVTAYGKSQKSDLTAAQRRDIAKYLEEVESDLSSRTWS